MSITVEQTNSGIEKVDEVEEEIMFVAKEQGVDEEGGIWFDESKVSQHSGFKEYDLYDPNTNDKCLLFYDWLVDSVTTSHICNSRDAFINYIAKDSNTVAGVGNAKVAIKG